MLLLAIICHIYDPHEYRVTSLRDGATSNLSYFGQHYPAWSGRISKGVNFPALILDYPLRGATRTLYVHGDIDHILIMISQADVGFFVAIVLFWFYVGWVVDRKRRPVTRNRIVRAAGRAFGLIFGVVTGAYAAKMTASEWFPERVIASFGTAWAVVLVVYFASRLIGEITASRKSKQRYQCL